MHELHIGYAQDQHPALRRVVGAAPDCRYLRLSDRNRFLVRAAALLNRSERRGLLDVPRLAQQFRARRLHPGVDVLHLFTRRRVDL